MPPKGFQRKETGYNKWTTHREFELILAEVEKEMYKDLWKTILYIGMYMGLRRGEIVRLRWTDIEGDYDQIRVRLLKKGHEVIHVRIIPDKVKQQLKIYEFSFRRFQRNKIYLFQPPQQSGSKRAHINPDSVTTKFKKWRCAAGLNDIYFQRADKTKLARLTFHTLRHWFATKIIDKGGVHVAKEIIGHTKIETTMKY